MTNPTETCQHDPRFRGVMFAKNGCACCAYEERIAELERDLAAAQRKVERLKAVRADYRDCIELAGKISERVETYDGDCLPEVIIPFLQPLIGELADRDRQIEGLRDAFQDARQNLSYFCGEQDIVKLCRDSIDAALQQIAARRQEQEGRG